MKEGNILEIRLRTKKERVNDIGKHTIHDFYNIW